MTPQELIAYLREHSDLSWGEGSETDAVQPETWM